MAAGTLDASAKIYAVRVDAVHADTYKVLGGLGRDSAPTKNADSPEGGAPFAPFLLSCSHSSCAKSNFSVLHGIEKHFVLLGEYHELPSSGAGKSPLSLSGCWSREG